MKRSGQTVVRKGSGESGRVLAPQHEDGIAVSRLGRWRGEPLEAAFAGSKEETNGDRTETRKSWVVNKTNATIAYDTCIA